MLTDTPPDFKQDVPDEVIIDLIKQEEVDGKISQTRRWLVLSMAKMLKQSDWLIEKRQEDSKKIDIIQTNVVATNGRVLKLEEKVAILEKDKSDISQIKDDIKLLVIAQKLAKTKWFWLFVTIFIYGGYSMVTNAEVIKNLPILKLLWGG